MIQKTQDIEEVMAGMSSSWLRQCLQLIILAMWFSASARASSADFNNSLKAIKEIRVKLGFGKEYETNPCKLMPFVELSPLLAIDELVVKLAKDPKDPILIDNKTAMQAKLVYYKVGLHSMKYGICLLTRKIGEDATLKVVQQWVSGYQNKLRRLAVLKDLKDSIHDGKTLASKEECLAQGKEDLKKHKIQKSVAKLVGIEIRMMKKRLARANITSAELKAATEATASQCLVYGSKITDQQKRATAQALRLAALFFHLLEGGVMQTVIGDRGNSELIYMLLTGIFSADFVSESERFNRAFLMFQGEIKAKQKCKGASADDCIKLIQ